MQRRLTIGLTGGIASGKTTVAERFLEHGVPVIDADESARIVVAPGQPGLRRIVEQFGEHVLSQDGALDRRALRRLVFDDSAKRKRLEAILHPLIRADMDERVARARGPYVVLAIPLLIEGGGQGRVDRVLVVDVDEPRQLERLMARDSSSLAEAHAILAAQASRAARLAAADDVLENFGTVSELRQAVDRLHTRYLELAGANF
jgi:dephospho-CoA kinase